MMNKVETTIDTTLREEIERRLASNQVYYAHFVSDGKPMEKIMKDTTKDILKIIGERIESIKEEVIKDECGDCLYALDKIKKELNKNK